MKITTITYMERKNKGNYEHEELSASANVDDGENSTFAMLTLKDAVHNALYGTVNKEIIAEEIIPEVTAPAVKEKKTRAKKEIVEEVTVEAVIPEIKKSTYKFVDSVSEAPSLPYNRDLDTHRQLLSSFLNKNHPSWKTTEGVKEFSMGLVGKPFLNADGAVVESFAKLLSDFFNA
jgi:uncharacterized membrane-anchored protein YjiN (DUF445 family)